MRIKKGSRIQGRCALQGGREGSTQMHAQIIVAFGEEALGFLQQFKGGTAIAGFALLGLFFLALVAFATRR